MKRGHPGAFVRESIIPSDISVTDAAKRLGVGRVALSNFLNGKSGLSAKMALRLEKAFGADREELLKMQAGNDRRKRRAEEKQLEVRAFVPDFLSIKARDIEDWAENRLAARELLPVLLRKLVNSTSDDVLAVDFAGYDNSQRRGRDGFVDAGAATPWVPEGRSFWEFGTNREPGAKADRDYAARVRSISPAERADSTFVFVTPRNWPGKGEWETRKGKAGDWKAVRAFDASDLEQWLEQSVPAQIWLSNELGLPTSGFETLRQAWHRWSDASEPPLTREIFSPAVATNADSFKEWLDKPCDRPFVVAADSRLEALAFLDCLFNDKRIDPSKGDLAAVFTCPETLRKLITSLVPFIPIVHSASTERELGGAQRRLHCIVLRHRNSVHLNADIELGLLRDDNFRQALTAMGIDEDCIARLARESGHSPTILRRRLSKVPAIRTPIWADDEAAAKELVAMALIGTWRSDVKVDQGILCCVGSRPYEVIEEEVMRLRRLDDSPVWAIGRYRGVASKIDALFAVAGAVTRVDIKYFFKAAKFVLGESDPALDLPEGDRWAAALFGKERSHSDELRKGVCETLVLLSVHGNHLFENQLGIDLRDKVASLIRKLLTPLTLGKVLSHHRELPYYAEAAPETFLQILEEDRHLAEPVILGLLQPTGRNALFTMPPRTGLLWALECLAWNPTTLARVSQILAWLSLTNVDDNWENKPEESLKTILRSWMPQTAASKQQRVATLKLLIRNFPEVAWRLCIEELRPGPSFSSPTYRPRWRNDASGAGQAVTLKEANEFTRQCLEVVLNWPNHNEKTLGSLIEFIHRIPATDQATVWARISHWSRHSGEDAKAALRERIRRFAFRAHSRASRLSETTRAAAREAYENLRVDDPVIRHNWLFANHWVRGSLRELDADEFNSSKRTEAINRLRRDAMIDIWSKRGFGGIQDLLDRSNAADLIGHYVALLKTDVSSRIDFVRHCLSIKGRRRKPYEQCLQGFLFCLREDSEATVLKAACNEVDSEDLERLFACAPFEASTWCLLEDRDANTRASYWKTVIPLARVHAPADLEELIDNLLSVGRPRAAFYSTQLQFEDIETSRLKRLLIEIATSDAEPVGDFLLDGDSIANALDSLDDRPGVTPDEMARLEFQFIHALDGTDHGTLNLETRIAQSPELFVQLVARVYKRSDEGADPPEWRIEDPRQREAAGLTAHRLLDQLKSIPGTDRDGKIQVRALTRWITEVRRLCSECGRDKIGDQMVGQLLAKAPAVENDMWPPEEVCQAIEGIASSEIGIGLEVGVANLRGAQLRAEGGSQERKLAAKYRAIAERLHFEYPNVGGVIERIADSYENEAKWWDSRAKIEKRLHA